MDTHVRTPYSHSLPWRRWLAHTHRHSRRVVPREPHRCRVLLLWRRYERADAPTARGRGGGDDKGRRTPFLPRPPVLCRARSRSSTTSRRRVSSSSGKKNDVAVPRVRPPQSTERGMPAVQRQARSDKASKKKRQKAEQHKTQDGEKKKKHAFFVIVRASVVPSRSFTQSLYV